MDDDAERFDRAVGSKAKLKLRAQKLGSPAWFGLGMLGVIGWSVVVPTVSGALLGRWIDAHHAGAHSWTLALLVAGLVLGCANAWHWVVSQTASDVAGDHD